MALNFSNNNDLLAQAISLHQAGRLADAEPLYLRVLQMQPGHPRALRALALVYFQTGRLDHAEQLFLRAAAPGPPEPLLLCNLGDVYTAMRRPDDALAAYDKATTLDPSLVSASHNAAVVLMSIGRFAEAARLWEKVFHEALRRGTPDFVRLAAEAANNLGEGLLQRGFPQDARQWHTRAAGLLPQHPGISSNLLRDLCYMNDIPIAQVRQEHDAWWSRHGSPPDYFTPSRDPNPDRPLRIGLLSPDFREHSVAHFLFPLFEHHYRTQFAFTGYAAGSTRDDFSRRLASACPQWRELANAGHAVVARQIEEDRIDILIDLAGHTGDNRLPVFAYRAAPVQVAWLGYPATVGGTAVQWRLTDAYADPPGMTDAEFSEKLWRLDRFAWCWRTPLQVPPNDRTPDPGAVVFGSFNALAKISPEAVALWAAVLRDVPGSRMLLKAASLQEPESKAHLEALFAGQGITPERLTLVGRQAESAEHLAWYRKIDVALDTFPYHGTTTTCEALWMGVPVVTLAGRRHVSRVGVSLLHTVDLEAPVAEDEAGFVTAAKAAVSVVRGAALRERMERSELRDEVGFARAFEAALRGMWREWCQSQTASIQAPPSTRVADSS